MRHFEVSAPEETRSTMPWHCIDCKENFEGPRDRFPEGGCPNCGSKKIFDCNVDLNFAIPVIRCPSCKGFQSVQSFVACGNQCVYCGWSQDKETDHAC
jgi:DNA-directed RNA polymerase subunit RPC12/RpoP